MVMSTVRPNPNEKWSSTAICSFATAWKHSFVSVLLVILFKIKSMSVLYRLGVAILHCTLDYEIDSVFLASSPELANNAVSLF